MYMYNCMNISDCASILSSFSISFSFLYHSFILRTIHPMPATAPMTIPTGGTNTLVTTIAATTSLGTDVFP